MKKVIAITGGIASGKSMATNYIRQKGFTVLDADTITHSIYLNGGASKPLRKAFGDSIFTAGKIDRKRLGSIIYNDSSKRALLNSIMHPLIYDEIKNQINKCSDDVLFIDVALLFEAGFDSLADLVLCIYASKDIRVKRLMERDNISYDYAMAKINSQMSMEEIRDRSDIVIDHSDNDLEKFYKDIDKVLKEECLNG